MTNKPLTKRKQQAIDTKKRIYKVFMDLMDRKEFENITITEICHKAKVSVGTFYIYYSSKYDILAEIFQKADDFFIEEVAPRLSGLSTIDQIMKYFYEYVQFTTEKGYNYTKHLYSANPTFFVKEGRPMHLLLVDILRKGQEKNEIKKDYTAEEIERILFISVWGTVFEWNLYNGKYDLNKTLKLRISLLLKVFVTDPEALENY